MILLNRNNYSTNFLLYKEVFINSVDLKGVISKMYHKNPQKFKKNIIATTDASDVSRETLYYGLDPTTGANERFISTDNSYTTFSFRFRNIKLNITSYTLVSENTGVAQLKSWNFSCSINGLKWNILHSAVNNSDMKGKSLNKTYHVTSLGLYSQCKIEQTGPSWDYFYPHYMIFQQIDLDTNFILMSKLCTNCNKRRNGVCVLYLVSFLYSIT